MSPERTLDWRSIKNALRLYNCAIFRPMLTWSRKHNKRYGYQREPLTKHFTQHETWIVPKRGGLALDGDCTKVCWSETQRTLRILEAIMDTDIKVRNRRA